MGQQVQWSGKNLKKRGKAVLHMHYWRIVLVTLLLSLLLGYDEAPQNDTDYMIQDGLRVVFQLDDGAEEVSAYTLFRDQWLEFWEQGGVALGVSMAAGSFLFGISSLGSILLAAFVTNPLQVGAFRFYIRAFDAKPRLKEVFRPFETRYRNVVSAMFLRDLYIILWSLLFVVPGIVKAYEYKMVPYLLAEQPGMQPKDALAASRQLMRGQKWRTFLLDLSFLGWLILSACTFGIVGILFVAPYRQMTFAALYRLLLGGGEEIPHNIYYDGMEDDFGTRASWRQ